MTTTVEPTVQWTQDQMLEVVLNEPDDFLKVREVVLGEQDKLVKGQNWDKFYLDNIISWWKKKAGKRYEKLKSEGRFRTEVELWTEDKDIQIIR